MLPVWTWLKNKIIHVVRNPTGEDIYGIVVLFETLIGLRPYVLVNSADGKPPRMQLSRLGCFMTFGHITNFAMCCVCMLYYDPPLVVISDDMLNIYEARILTWLQCLNTFVIFTLVNNYLKTIIEYIVMTYFRYTPKKVFIHRNHDATLMPLHRRVSDHFNRITAYRSERFYRKATVVTFVAFFTVVTMNVLIFTSKIYFMIDALRELPLWQVFVFSAATVFPMMYVEVILVQFALSLYLMRMQTDVLTEVLEDVCREETKLAPYELGQY